VREWIAPALTSPDLVLVSQPPAQPHRPRDRDLRLFRYFGKGLGNGPSFFDWVLFGLGVLATIALAILVIRKTKTKFAEENPT
jgi:hypothetical protein